MESANQTEATASNLIKTNSITMSQPQVLVFAAPKISDLKIDKEKFSKTIEADAQLIAILDQPSPSTGATNYSKQTVGTAPDKSAAYPLSTLAEYPDTVKLYELTDAMLAIAMRQEIISLDMEDAKSDGGKKEPIREENKLRSRPASALKATKKRAQVAQEAKIQTKMHQLPDAKSLVKQKNWMAALKELDAIINQNDDQLQSAQWLKALCLLEVKRNEEAKLVLIKLITPDGIYCNQASLLLQKLQ